MYRHVFRYLNSIIICIVQLFTVALGRTGNAAQLSAGPLMQAMISVLNGLLHYNHTDAEIPTTGPCCPICSGSLHCNLVALQSHHDDDDDEDVGIHVVNVSLPGLAAPSFWSVSFRFLLNAFFARNVCSLIRKVSIDFLVPPRWQKKSKH